MNPHLKGIVATLIATLLFASQDAVTKHLMSSLHISQILFVRFSVFTVFALILCHQRNGILIALRANRPWLQISRGLMIVIEMVIFAYALHLLGIAPTHALFASFPIMVTALSIPLLGEAVGMRRWVAVITGFLGTLIILKPGFGVIHPGALIALLGGLMFALYNLMTRLAARTDSFETSLLYFGLVGLAFSTLLVPFYWKMPNIQESGWLLVVSMTGMIGHYLLIKALEITPAAVLQPFNYFILLWAMIVGYLIYDEVLDPVTLLGATIVISSGIFIARREYALSRLRRTKTPGKPLH